MIQRDNTRSKSLARASRLLAALAAVAVVGTACSDDPEGPGPVAAEWTTTAVAYRGLDGAQVRFSCPAAGTAATVRGTDVYTDDSSVCTAAVHAGKIVLANGGIVTFEVAEGEATYTGSTRNGITSEDYLDTWPGSFIFP